MAASNYYGWKSNPINIERVKTTCTVYECTKYLIYEKFIIE